MDWLGQPIYPSLIASLLFWPGYQLAVRRWTIHSKYLLGVFVGTATVLSTYCSLLCGPWRAQESFAPLFWMPVVSLTSVVISAMFCLVKTARPFSRILRWFAIVVFVLLFIQAVYVRFILDWRGQPVCHKGLMFAFEAWTDEGDTNAFPNIAGSGRDSLRELRDEYPRAHLEDRYGYVAGLHRDDPGDLILMYVNKPTRWVWHGVPKTIFDRQAWIVVPVDFTMGLHATRNTKVIGAGECSETLSTEQFLSRLQLTLDFVRTNNRPNWQAVVAEHTKFLESLEPQR
jgi:hypothetical protein